MDALGDHSGVAHHAAGRGILDEVVRLDAVQAEIVEREIDHSAGRLGREPLPPLRRGDPIAQLGPAVCAGELEADRADERATLLSRDRPGRALARLPVRPVPPDEFLRRALRIRVRDRERVAHDGLLGEVAAHVGRIVGDEGPQEEPVRDERREGLREKAAGVGHPPLWRIAPVGRQP